MARPNKIGLDYFPLDVDIFDDEKMTAISGEFGIKGEITVIKLLCAIYKNGYFVLWNDLFKFKLARNLPGMSPELIESIVNRLVLWEFFDKALFDSVKVLTSKGIQKRYFEASRRRKITRDLPYLLIDEVCGCEGNETLSSVDGLMDARSTVSGCGVNVCNNSPLGDSETSSTYGENPSASVNVCKNGVNVYNNSVNVCKNTTNKRKEKEIKENTPNGVSKKAADATFPTPEENPSVFSEEERGLNDSGNEERKSCAKKKEKETELVDLRKQKFYDSLIPYVQRYGKRMVREFYNYWSELNKSRTRMKFEYEKTWELERRLTTWASNDERFSKNTASKSNYGKRNEFGRTAPEDFEGEGWTDI